MNIIAQDNVYSWLKRTSRLGPLDVRLWPEADIPNELMNVRFWGKADVFCSR